MLDTGLRSTIGLVALRSIHGVGEATAEGLLARFTTFREMLEAPPEAFKGAANQTLAASLRSADIVGAAMNSASATLEAATGVGARLISPYDEDFPARLHDCDPKISVLYVAGDLSIAERSVACVGTRDPSDYGATVTDKVATFLATSGWTIVSGLARGVDWISHQAALRAGVPTLAIIGSGLDSFYSDEAAKLADRIVEEGGCVITEQPFGRKADQGTLIRRNRIQSGISVATFALQFNIDSGTMHTVRYAISQGRPIFCPSTPARFAAEPMNAGADAVTGLTGSEFAQVIEMKESVRQVVEERFATTPVGRAIGSRDDYPKVLEALEANLAVLRNARAELGQPSLF